MALKGLNAHRKRLQKLQSAQSMKIIGKGLFAGGELVQVTAQGLITAGSVSGSGHVSSAPGEPPNRDTGLLDSNIETTQPSPLLVRVSSNAPYSKPLEFGTSKMAPRPSMTPARDITKKPVRDLVVRATNEAVRKSRSSD